MRGAALAMRVHKAVRYLHPDIIAEDGFSAETSARVPDNLLGRRDGRGRLPRHIERYLLIILVTLSSFTNSHHHGTEYLFLAFQVKGFTREPET